jgi:hypothetical protein
MMTRRPLLALLREALGGDRRRAGRYRVALDEAVIAPSGPGAVTIVDLSLTGAMIDGPALPPPGTAVTLRWDSLAVRARVAWTKGDRGGLHFERPLAVEQLFTLVHFSRYRDRGIPAALAA